MRNNVAALCLYNCDWTPLRGRSKASLRFSRRQGLNIRFYNKMTDSDNRGIPPLWLLTKDEIPQALSPGYLVDYVGDIDESSFLNDQ